MTERKKARGARHKEDSGREGMTITEGRLRGIIQNSWKGLSFNFAEFLFSADKFLHPANSGFKLLHGGGIGNSYVPVIPEGGARHNSNFFGL